MNSFVFIKVSIYSVVPILAIQQMTQSYTFGYIPFLVLSSIMVNPKRVDIIPCAVQ